MSSRVETFTTTAPAKIILFGEHAVVYGKPALAVPVTSVSVTVTVTPDTVTRLEALTTSAHLLPDNLNLDEITDPLLQMIVKTAQFFGEALPACRFSIASTIPVASGLGSGAAVSAALGRATAKALGRTISDPDLNALVYDIERIHHGTPSGVDNTVIVYQKPVFFVRGSPPQPFEVKKPARFLIADTGRTALTRESVGDVRKLYEANQAKIQPILDEIGTIVDLARQALSTGAIITLGHLMWSNHRCLQKLTVSSPELDNLVHAALEADALGAKLSGGGRGGNMIALVTPDKEDAVAEALKRAGAHNIIATTLEAS